MRHIVSTALGTLAFALAQTCAAHVTLANSQAETGSYFKATLVIGHGCNGSPTRAVTVFVPKGIVIAKPQPKSGWTVEVSVVRLQPPLVAHGKPLAERVTHVRWSGSELPDNQFDDFSLLVQLPEQAGTLPFRVLQECAQGQSDWSEEARAGHRPRFPAPVLEIAPRPERNARR